MKESILLFVLLISCAMISSCNVIVESEEEEGKLDIEILHEGNILTTTDFSVFPNNKTRKQSLVFRSQEDYDDTLLEYTDEDSEILDFSEGRVLLVDMGPRGSGGYSTKISSVSEHNNYVLVNVVFYKPGTNCLASMATTNPFKFVWIPSTKEILVRETLEIKDCSE